MLDTSTMEFCSDVSCVADDLSAARHFRPHEPSCNCPLSSASDLHHEETIEIDALHDEDCHLYLSTAFTTPAETTDAAELYDEACEDEDQDLEDEPGVLLRAFVAVSIYLCRHEKILSLSVSLARVFAIRSLCIIAQVLLAITGLLAMTSILMFSAASTLCLYEAFRIVLCDCCELAATSLDTFASGLRSGMTLLFLEFALRHMFFVLVIGIVITLESAVLAQLLSTISYGRLPAAASTWSKRFNSRREPCILGRLGGLRTMAFPDTGAAANFMSLEYAQRHKLDICRSATSKVRIGTGAIIETVGTVVLPFRFNGETKDHLLSFGVLSTSTHDVVLGKPFLLFTETLTRRPDRITSRYYRSTARCTSARVCLLGSADFVNGQADGVHANAVMDTGASVSLMSERFARENGYNINTDAEYRVPMEFADKTTTKAVGMVHGVSWNYDGQARKSSLNVYVLRDLPADLLLGYGFLRETDAFTTQATGFWESKRPREDFDTALPFHIVRVADKYSPPCEFPSTDHVDLAG
jgi:hypothetical protein